MLPLQITPKCNMTSDLLCYLLITFFYSQKKEENILFFMVGRY